MFKDIAKKNKLTLNGLCSMLPFDLSFKPLVLSKGSKVNAFRVEGFRVKLLR